MAYGLVIPVKIAAQNVDAWNRSAVSDTIQENGNIMELVAKSATAGEGEVWTAVQPATLHLANLWMVLEPEVVVTDSKYKGLDPDPRNFTVAANKVMSVYKPALGDLILVTTDAIAGDIATGDYPTATNADWQLTWAAAAGAGLTYHRVETTYISIADGGINPQRTTAYLLECVKV